MARNLISVIDDDKSVRRTTTLLIQSFGFKAAAFESAESFLGSVDLDNTACLIVDVRMPGMNGLDLQSRLAAAGCRIPIIFITAFDDKEVRRRAMQAGAVAFLGKPFSDEQLLHTIRSALDHENTGTQSWTAEVHGEFCVCWPDACRFEEVIRGLLWTKLLGAG